MEKHGGMPGQEDGGMFTPSPEVMEQAIAWLKTGVRMYPKAIMDGGEHIFECFSVAVEMVQNDPRFNR